MDKERQRYLFDKDYRIKKLKKEVIKLAAIRFLAPIGVAIMLHVLITKIEKRSWINFLSLSSRQ